MRAGGPGDRVRGDRGGLEPEGRGGTGSGTGPRSGIRRAAKGSPRRCPAPGNRGIGAGGCPGKGWGLPEAARCRPVGPQNGEARGGTRRRR